ncbi:MAG: redoxin family protein [Caldilineales bacterium]|nr:redoxin family protein [Caldilineales bacterium]
MTEITCAVESSETPVPGSLKLGDAVPAYAPQWLKGGPVAWLEPDKLYLVECWATWCGPCRATIPHVDALHRKYGGRGLVVIGQNVWEDDREAVLTFIREQGEAMSYPVAADDGSFARDWLTAAGVEGIPHAFIVREGKLLWKCHPSELDETVLESMLEGTFDFEAAGRVVERRRALYAEVESLMQAGDWPAVQRTLETIIEEQGDDGVVFAQKQRFAVLAGTGQYELAAEELRRAMAAGDQGAIIEMLLNLRQLRNGTQSSVVMALAVEAVDSLLVNDRQPGLLVLAAEMKGHAGHFADAEPLMREALEATTQEGKVPAVIQKLHDAIAAGRVPPRAEIMAWNEEGLVARTG